MIPDVAFLRYPLEDVQTMVFELSLIRTAFASGVLCAYGFNAGQS